MKLSKKIFKSQIFQAFLCRVAYFYILFAYKTSRWQLIFDEKSKQIIAADEKVILSFWHGRLLMIPAMYPNARTTKVIISKHGDGEIISNIIKYFNIKTIRGSSTKGAVSAVKEVLKSLSNNEIVAFTPDGPRGPRMRISGNIIQIASKTQAPIIPITFATSKCKIINSWDRFMLAKPFSKGVMIYGEPFIVAKGLNNAELEKASNDFENILNSLTAKADQMVGVQPVQPA